MINIGKYSFCFLDLITDGRSGKLSATKLWLHISNIIMSKVMLTQSSVDWELMAAYGSIVGGSYIAAIFMKRKYPYVASNEPENDSGGGDNPDSGIRSPLHKHELGRGRKGKGAGGSKDIIG